MSGARNSGSEPVLNQFVMGPVFELSGFMGQGVTIVPETETVIVRTGFGPWIMGDLLERVFPALGVDGPTRMAMETD